MNSSIAASMMAWRRSSVRSARLDGGLGGAAFGKAGCDALADAAFAPRRRAAGRD
jgi:hypothetical protein